MAEVRGLAAHPLSARMFHPAGLDLVRRLQALGHRAFFTGGCVRDLVLRVYPRDFDIGTSATGAELAGSGMERARGRRRDRSGSTLSRGDTIDVDVFPMDDPPWIPEAEWRQQPRSGDVARDFAEAFDFTVNALQYDPVTDLLVDYVDGLHDLEQRTLRAVGDPDRQLARNRVAVVRAVILACKRGLAIEPRTWEAMRRNARAFSEAMPNQRNETLIKLLSCGASARAVGMSGELGILDHLFPPALVDVLASSARMDRYLAALDAEPLDGVPIAVLPALLLCGATGGASAEEVARMTAELAARFPLSPAIWRDASAAVLVLHGRAGHPRASGLRTGAARRRPSRTLEALERLVVAAHATQSSCGE